jgi:biopolymer transport protein ExbD
LDCKQASRSLRADKAVSYGEPMEVMSLLRNACYLKVALSGLTNEIDGSERLCSARAAR